MCVSHYLLPYYISYPYLCKRTSNPDKVHQLVYISSFTAVVKMASHAIFQYNVLAIDDTHNTCTNICVKIIIIRLIGPRDEKIQNPEEIRSKGPKQR